MATAPPDLSPQVLWPSALLWVGVGGWAYERLPPDGRAGLPLALGWLVLLLLAQSQQRGAACCPAPRPRWSDLTMGLMMGTLWWHADGCLTGAGPAALWVALHLAFMAAPLCLPQPLRQRLSRHWRHGLGLVLWLLVFGLAVSTPTRPETVLALMAALSLVWVLEPVHWRGSAVSHLRGLRWATGLALLAGPLGLWWVHQAWPVQGPVVLWWGLAWLAAAAAFVQCGVAITCFKGALSQTRVARDLQTGWGTGDSA